MPSLVTHRAGPALSIALVLSGFGLACKSGTGPPDTSASRLGFAVAPAGSAQSGVVLSPAPVVQLLDPQGDPVATAGRNITAVLTTTGGALQGTLTVKTDGAGKATFANLAIAAATGVWRLRFDSPGLSSVTSDAIQLGAGPVAALVAVSGNLQTAVAGTPVQFPPSVRATDGAGNPVAGVPVSFVASNGGSVDGANTTTAPTGLAAPLSWTLGTALGLNTLTATSSALAGIEVLFTATGSVGPPAMLTLVAGDGQNATVGGLTPVAPAAKLTDAFGHPLASVAVSFTVSAGGGALTTPNPLTDASGVATVGSWSLGLLPGTNALTISRTGVPSIMVQATGVAFPVATIAVGGAHSCAVDADGAGFCWGNNATGQIGNGAAAPALVPTAVSGGLGFTMIAAGAGHSCGIISNGDAYCWGLNDVGQLGDGTLIPHSTPAIVSGGLKFSLIVSSGSFNCGLQVSDGAAFCWGAGGNGQIGDGFGANRRVPTAVVGGHFFVALSVGSAHACGLKATGALFCWGSNGNGRLGDGTATSSAIPVAVTGGFSFLAVAAGGAHTCGIITGGAGYCWGNGGNGRLGTGSTTDQPVPTAVTGGLTFTAISAHLGHTCAIATDGQGQCWGFNGSGQLGDGSTTQRLAPTAVLGGLTYAVIVAGGDHTCARSTGGAAYCWGRNDVGMIGDGTIINRTKPVGAVRP